MVVEFIPKIHSWCKGYTYVYIIFPLTKWLVSEFTERSCGIFHISNEFIAALSFCLCAVFRIMLLFLFLWNSSPGSPLKPSQQYLGSVAPINLSLNSKHIGKAQLSTSKRSFTVQAGYRYSVCPCIIILILMVFWVLVCDLDMLVV